MIIYIYYKIQLAPAKNPTHLWQVNALSRLVDATLRFMA